MACSECKGSAFHESRNAILRHRIRHQMPLEATQSHTFFTLPGVALLRLTCTQGLLDPDGAMPRTPKGGRGMS